jgi:outer membrane protein assembly factor BamE (lipoprotein component of BamABCDE complex)
MQSAFLPLRRAVRQKIFTPLLIAAPLAFSLAACSPVIEERGYKAEPGDLEQLKPGDSKTEVEALLGSPSTAAIIDNEAWFYISSKVEKYLFYEPEEIDRTVVAVYFDDQEAVEEVAYYTLEDGRIVNLVDRKTPTRGKQLTILGEIFGNLGRFNRPGGSSAVPTPGRRR